MNGQVVMWDITESLSSIDQRKRKQSVRHVGRQGAGREKENAGGEEAPASMPPVRPLSISHIDMSHRRLVGDLAWLPPSTQVGRWGEALACFFFLFVCFFPASVGAGDGRRCGTRAPITQRRWRSASTSRGGGDGYRARELRRPVLPGSRSSVSSRNAGDEHGQYPAVGGAERGGSLAGTARLAREFWGAGAVAGGDRTGAVVIDVSRRPRGKERGPCTPPRAFGGALATVNMSQRPLGLALVAETSEGWTRSVTPRRAALRSIFSPPSPVTAWVFEQREGGRK